MDDLARRDGDSESMIATNKRQRNEDYNKVWELDFVSKELIIGIIFGGRLGYVLIYNLEYYLNDLIKIFYNIELL